MKTSLLVSAILCSGLAQEVPEFDSNGCAVGFSRAQADCDLFEAKAPLTTADFTITYHNTFKIITNALLDDAFEGQPVTYVAYQCGTEKPSTETLNALNVVAPEFVQIPINKFGVASSTFLPFFQALGLEDRIALFPETTSLPSCADTGLEVFDCFGECFTNTWRATDDVDVFFFDQSSSFSYPVPDSTANRDFTAVIFSGDDVNTVENNAVTREWFYFLSAFFNLEAEAHEYVQNLAFETECLENNIESLPENTAVKNVLLTTFYFDRKWGLPGCPAYHCEFIETADPNVRIITAEDLLPPPGDDEDLTSANLLERLGDIRVDKLIHLGPLVVPEAQLAAGYGDGPQQNNLTDFEDLVTGLEAARGENPPFEFASFFLPDTDAWFHTRPGLPHVTQLDFLEMVSPERLEGLSEAELASLGFEENLFFFAEFVAPFDADTVYETSVAAVDTCGNFAARRTCVELQEADKLPIISLRCGAPTSFNAMALAFAAVLAIAFV